jgi:hypothetical protein
MADTGWAIYVLHRVIQIYVVNRTLLLNKFTQSTDYFLKLENMKSESRVIVDHYATVNMFCNLVLTARHVSGVGFIKVITEYCIY